MLATQGGKKKQQGKICQCNWKTKGSLPKKIMRSHQSNVRLGTLLQLTGFTYQQKEASRSLTQMRLRLLNTALEWVTGSGGGHNKVWDYHLQPWTSSCFLFWLLDYGEVETSTFPTHKRNKRKTFLILTQAEWRQRKACARELGFSLLRRAKHCFLPWFPSGTTINWVWPWHYCEEAWEITCVFSYFDAEKSYFWWQQPSPFCLFSWPIFYFHPRKQCLYLSIPQPCHHLSLIPTTEISGMQHSMKFRAKIQTDNPGSSSWLAMRPG